MKSEIKSKRVRAIIDELKDQYMEADTNCRPWIIGFSGGKDSQVVLDLVTRVIPSEDVSVVYSDTGYELPTSLELYKEVEKTPTMTIPFKHNGNNKKLATILLTVKK